MPAHRTNRQNPLPWLRQRRRSGMTVGFFGAVLLGVLSMPCTMAWANTEVSSVSPAEPVHDHGADRAADAIDLECCCDLSLAVATDKDPSPPKSPSIAWAADSLLARPPGKLAAVLVAAPSRADLHETSPPLYLTTLRLRI